MVFFEFLTWNLVDHQFKTRKFFLHLRGAWPGMKKWLFHFFSPDHSKKLGPHITFPIMIHSPMAWLGKIFNNWSVVESQQLDDWKGKVVHFWTSSTACIYYKNIFYFPISVYDTLSRLGLGLNFCANLGHFWSKGTECTAFIQKKATFSFLAILLFVHVKNIENS